MTTLAAAINRLRERAAAERAMADELDAQYQPPTVGSVDRRQLADDIDRALDALSPDTGADKQIARAALNQRTTP